MGDGRRSWLTLEVGNGPRAPTAVLARQSGLCTGVGNGPCRVPAGGLSHNPAIDFLDRGRVRDYIRTVSANSKFTIALHSLALLGEPDAEWASSDWIASSIQTNPVVVRRALGQLAVAGLVATAKGPRGGYRLARPSENITLQQVYEAVKDEGLLGLHAHPPNPDCPVGSQIQKHLSTIYDEAEAALEDALRARTLASLKHSLAVA